MSLVISIKILIIYFHKMMNIYFNQNNDYLFCWNMHMGADLAGIDLEEYKERKMWDMRRQMRIEKLVSTNKGSRQTAGKTILWWRKQFSNPVSRWISGYTLHGHILIKWWFIFIWITCMSLILNKIDVLCTYKYIH